MYNASAKLTSLSTNDQLYDIIKGFIALRPGTRFSKALGILSGPKRQFLVNQHLKTERRIRLKLSVCREPLFLLGTYK